MGTLDINDGLIITLQNTIKMLEALENESLANILFEFLWTAV